MAGNSRKLTTSSVDHGRRLAEFVAERLGIDATRATDLIRRGSVYVDRRRIEDPDRTLEAGQRITAYVDDSTAPAHGAPAPAATPVVTPAPSTAGSALAVVYRDPEVLVVDKPAGVPSQATRGSAQGALDRAVQAMEGDARLVHRLDRDASGLVLFSRSAGARQRFARLLADRRLRRIYTAVAWGHVAGDQGRLDALVGPDPRDRRRMTAGVGRPAETDFRVLRRGHSPAGAATTLLELELGTGRTHQIRVHLAHAGHPLAGDRLYGPAVPPEAVERLCLHACLLSWPGGRATSAAPALFDRLVVP